MPSLGQGAQIPTIALAQYPAGYFANPSVGINAPRPRERQPLKPVAGQGAPAFSKSLSLGRVLGNSVFCITPFGRELELFLGGLYSDISLAPNPSPNPHQAPIRSLVSRLGSYLFAKFNGFYSFRRIVLPIKNR